MQLDVDWNDFEGKILCDYALTVRNILIDLCGQSLEHVWLRRSKLKLRKAKPQQQLRVKHNNKKARDSYRAFAVGELESFERSSHK